MAPDLQPDAQAFARRVCEFLGDTKYVRSSDAPLIGECAATRGRQWAKRLYREPVFTFGVIKDNSSLEA
jgi:hypothetical protein